MINFINEYTNLFFAFKFIFDLLTEYRQQNLSAFGHFEEFRINQFFNANHFRLSQTARSDFGYDFHNNFAIFGKIFNAKCYES